MEKCRFNLKKVFNLEHLLSELNQIKADAKEICDFDNNDIFSYQRVDKELYLILRMIVTPVVDLQIDETKTLFELDNFFNRSSMYTCPETIRTEYRCNKTNFNRHPHSNIQRRYDRTQHANIVPNCMPQKYNGNPNYQNNIQRNVQQQSINGQHPNF